MGTKRLKVKKWKNIFHANSSKNRAGVAKISDSIDFNPPKKITRDKEGHYTLIKGSTQEDIIIINIHTPNKATSKYVKQTLTKLKEELDSSTIIVGDFHTSLSIMTTRQKVNKGNRELE